MIPKYFTCPPIFKQLSKEQYNKGREWSYNCITVVPLLPTPLIFSFIQCFYKLINNELK